MEPRLLLGNCSVEPVFSNLYHLQPTALRARKYSKQPVVGVALRVAAVVHFSDFSEMSTSSDLHLLSLIQIKSTDAVSQLVTDASSVLVCVAPLWLCPGCDTSTAFQLRATCHSSSLQEKRMGANQ
eukprot:3937997-Rhodomonas_salina.1